MIDEQKIMNQYYNNDKSYICTDANLCLRQQIVAGVKQKVVYLKQAGHHNYFQLDYLILIVNILNLW